MALLERLRGRLSRGEFSRSVLTLVAGTGLAQVIVIASSPVLTRLYPPADFGIFSVAMSIMAILITVTCLRFEFAIPLPASDDVAANVLALALVVNVVMSVVALAVLWLVGDAILGAIGASALGAGLILVSLGQLGGGIMSGLTNWAVRTKEFSTIAATRMTQSLALVAVQIVLGIAGLGAVGLLFGAVVGRVVGSGRLARTAALTHADAFRRVSRAGIVAVARRYHRFATISSPSALLNALGQQAPLLLLVALYGAEVGGFFALADRVCSIPLTLVAGAVGQVFLAEAAANAHTEPHAIRGLFVRTTWSLLRLAIGPTVVLAVLAPILAGPVFGGDWGEAGLYVAILAPMYLAAFVATATGDGLYVLERLDLQLLREIIRFALLGGAVFAAAAAGLPAVGAVIVLSVAGCITYVLYGLITWWAIVANRGGPVRPTADAAIVESAAPDFPEVGL